MKQETFKKAKELEARIEHISKIISFLKIYDYSLQPPTRMSNFDIYKSDRDFLNLNEGEAVAIVTALENEKSRLQQEFSVL